MVSYPGILYVRPLVVVPQAIFPSPSMAIIPLIRLTNLYKHILHYDHTYCIMSNYTALLAVLR